MLGWSQLDSRRLSLTVPSLSAAGEGLIVRHSSERRGRAGRTCG
ncbi:hypothetical protein ACFPRL_05095 [Pseudoclavibacter helvolus]